MMLSIILAEQLSHEFILVELTLNPTVVECIEVIRNRFASIVPALLVRL